MEPACCAAAAAQAAAAAAAIGELADASRAWQNAVGSAFVGWAMAQAQAGADFGIAGAIAGATAGKAGAAAGTIYSAAVSKAAGDLTRALNAVQTGFVDAATAASVKATKTIAAAETVERKAVAKADVVLAQDLQTAWGTYAAAERSAVTLNARERATIGADYKKEVAGAELAAVKAVAPARKTSMVAAAEANGVYHVKVTGIVADLGILGGEIKVEQVKASHSLISPATLKKWLDVLSTCGDMTVAAVKGLAQGAANSPNGAQDSFAHTGNLFLTYVNTVADVTDAFVGTPKDQRIRVPMIPLVDWSRGRFVAETDSDHGTSKTAGGFGLGVLGPMGYARLASLRNLSTVDGAGLLAKNLATRAWPAASVETAIARHAGNNCTTWLTATGKRIFENPQTGRQVVVDLQGGYFRIFQPNAVGSSKGTYLNMLGREVRPARHTPNGIQNPLLRDLDKGMWQQETHFFIEEILRKAR